MKIVNIILCIGNGGKKVVIHHIKIGLQLLFLDYSLFWDAAVKPNCVLSDGIVAVLLYLFDDSGNNIYNFLDILVLDLILTK